MKPGEKVRWQFKDGASGEGTFISDGADADHALVSVDSLVVAADNAKMDHPNLRSKEVHQVVHCLKALLVVIP